MTFNLLAAGNPASAAEVMQNLRHVNYGNVLLPVDSDGAGVDNTIDLGSSSYGFKDGYFDGTVTAGTVTAGTVTDGTVSITGGNLTGATGVTATNLTGTLQTAAQGNITSLGTLTALQIDNLNANGNTISSTSGNLNLTPWAGSKVLIDSHWGFDGTTMAAQTDANTTITAYAGRNITIESVTFDGGVVGGVSNLTMSGTLDLGTNTITDGTFDGDWSFGGHTLSSIGILTATTANVTTLDLGTNTITDGAFSGTWAFDSNTLYVDSVNNRVGVGKTNPAYPLDVTGNLQCDSMYCNGTLYADSAVFNDTGANANFRVESDTSTHMLYVEGSSNRVGINDSSPISTLSIGGGVYASGSIQTGSSILSTGDYVGSQAYLAIGAQTTKQTPGAGYIALYFNSTDDKVYAVNSSGTQIEIGDFSP